MTSCNQPIITIETIKGLISQIENPQSAKGGKLKGGGKENLLAILKMIVKKLKPGTTTIVPILDENMPSDLTNTVIDDDTVGEINNTGYIICNLILYTILNTPNNIGGKPNILLALNPEHEKTYNTILQVKNKFFNNLKDQARLFVDEFTSLGFYHLEKKDTLIRTLMTITRIVPEPEKLGSYSFTIKNDSSGINLECFRNYIWTKDGMKKDDSFILTSDDGFNMKSNSINTNFYSICYKIVNFKSKKLTLKNAMWRINQNIINPTDKEISEKSNTKFLEHISGIPEKIRSLKEAYISEVKLLINNPEFKNIFKEIISETGLTIPQFLVSHEVNSYEYKDYKDYEGIEKIVKKCDDNKFYLVDTELSRSFSDPDQQSAGKLKLKKTDKHIMINDSKRCIYLHKNKQYIKQAGKLVPVKNVLNRKL
jgi:hypothetical protein